MINYLFLIIYWYNKFMIIDKLYSWVIDDNPLQIKSALKSVDYFIKNNNINKLDRILLLVDDEATSHFKLLSLENFVIIMTFSEFYENLRIDKDINDLLKKQYLLRWMLMPFVIEFFNIEPKYFFVFDNDTLSKIDGWVIDENYPISGKSIFDFSLHEYSDLNKIKNFYDDYYVRSDDINKSSLLKLYENKNSKISFRQTMPLRLMNVTSWKEYEDLYKHKCNGGFWIINKEIYLDFFKKDIKLFVEYFLNLYNYYIKIDFRYSKISDEELVFYIFRKDVKLIRDEHINFYPSNTKKLINIKNYFIMHFAGPQCKRFWNEYLEFGYVNTNSDHFKIVAKNYQLFEKTLWIWRLRNIKDDNIFSLNNKIIEKIFNTGQLKTGVSLIVTLYKPKFSEINFWAKIYNKWDGEMFFLIDNPDFNIKILENRGINKKNIYQNIVNKGKLLTIMDFSKENIITNTHIKICDPDDYISIKLLKDLEKSIKNEWKNEIIHFNATCNKSNYIIKNQWFLTRNILKNSHYNPSNLANNQIILPTKPLYEWDHSFSQRLDSSDDKILVLIALLKGSKIQHIKKPFYLYRAAYGESNSKNLSIFLKNNIDVYNEMYEIVKLHGYMPDEFDMNKTIDWFLKKIDYSEDIKYINLMNNLISIMQNMQKLLKE